MPCLRCDRLFQKGRPKVKDGKQKLVRKDSDKTQTDEKTLTPEKLSGDASERKSSIWHRRDIDRLFSEIPSPSVQMFIGRKLSEEFKPLRYKWPKEVYLFDVAESSHRNFELEERFGMYMPQSYFKSKLRSTTLKCGTSNNFNDIVCLYKQFALVNVDEEKKGSQNDNFQNELFQALFFTIPEGYTLEADKISAESNWLKLMSWWKMINQSLVPCCQELHRCLTANTGSAERNPNVSQLRNDMNDLLQKLNLISLPAEIVVIETLVKFSNTLLDIEAWSVIQENAIKGFQQHCLRNVSQDSSWRRFLKECSHYTLSLFCDVLEIISKKGLDVNNIEIAIVSNIEDFVSQVIKQHLTEKGEEDYANALTEVTLKKFDKFFTEINVRKIDSGCSLATVIYLCYQMLSSLMQVTVRNFEDLFGDSYITHKKAISKYLFNTVLNGSIVANKMQNDSLITRDLLFQFKDEKMLTSITDFSVERYLKFAYILNVSYEIINEKNWAMVFLPSNYIQHDFVSFFNDIKRELNIIPQTELSMIEFSLEMGNFQNQLLQELGKSLSNITKAVTNAKILLNKSKYC